METFKIGNYICYKQKIGKGSTSSVYKGYHEFTNVEVAVKKMDYANIDEKLKKQITRETELMKTLTHENIVELYDVIYDPKISDYIYLILEYCHQGDLSKFLNKRPMKEKYAKKYMIQLIEGLKYLSENNIIHRDLKPQNIMVTNNDIIKICDFGFARYVDQHQSMLKTLCGTPLYMAPEIINHSKYSNKADLWSIGIILYEILFAKRPYNATTFYNLVQQINNNSLVFPNYIEISTSCQDLIKSLLIKDPEKRISWTGFFNHPWFTNKVHNIINKSISLNEILLFSDDLTISNDSIIKSNELINSSDISISENNTIKYVNESNNHLNIKSQAINIPTKKIKNNYIHSNSEYSNSPIFKSIDNNDFIIVESPQDRVIFSEPTNSNLVGNVKEYINMSLDMLKNSFNYVNDYKSI
jgi:serine/threonine protein kinase